MALVLACVLRLGWQAPTQAQESVRSAPAVPASSRAERQNRRLLEVPASARSFTAVSYVPSMKHVSSITAQRERLCRAR